MIGDPSHQISLGFDGIKILHVSDLHNEVFGKEQTLLIEKSKQLQPDYVFITGYLIGRKFKNIKGASEYIRGIKNIAPIYYVAGNHEWEAGKAGEILWDLLVNCGVNVLHDTIVELQHAEDRIQLIGIDDPYCLKQKKDFTYDRMSSAFFLKRLSALLKGRRRGFTILLSHRPEFMHFYKKAGIDLIFSGHAHGGQIRLPWVGGVLAPHQGFFPKYAEGVKTEENTTMIISRGLGNSTFPIRINNRPELVLVRLKSKM